MAAHSANIASIAAVGRFKSGLAQFESDVQSALTNLDLECRRPVAWIEYDRARYWKREEQKAADAVVEARQELDRCEIGAGDDARSCSDERKALEKATRRMRTAEVKVREIRHWQMTIKKAVEEFQVQISKLRGYLEHDVPRAAASLERMATALDQYVAVRAPDGMSSPSGTSSTSEPEPPKTP